MIQLVMNGSFRSGTTLMWRLMRNSNPQALTFAEPLHNQLFETINNEKDNGKFHLHGFSTTQEYSQIGEEFLTALREKHPQQGNAIYVTDASQTCQYLQVFHKLPRPVLIKCTRLHFVLDELASAFQCKIVHLMRHPFDTFLSCSFTGPKLKWLRNQGILAYPLLSLKNQLPFYLEHQFQFASSIHPLRQPYHRHLQAREYLMALFVGSWTVANWHAIQKLEKAGGLVTRYEDITNPQTSAAELQRIASYAGIALHPTAIRERAAPPLYPVEIQQMTEIAGAIGVGHEWNTLLERFQYA